MPLSRLGARPASAVPRVRRRQLAAVRPVSLSLPAIRFPAPLDCVRAATLDDVHPSHAPCPPPPSRASPLHRGGLWQRGTWLLRALLPIPPGVADDVAPATASGRALCTLARRPTRSGVNKMSLAGLGGVDSAAQRSKFLHDIGAWAGNVSTSVFIVFINKLLMKTYAYHYATTLVRFGVLLVAGGGGGEEAGGQNPILTDTRYRTGVAAAHPPPPTLPPCRLPCISWSAPSPSGSPRKAA